MSDQINIIQANIEDDLNSIFELINKAYDVETGNSGVAFKSTPRFQNANDLLNEFKEGRVYKAINENNDLVGCIIFEFLYDKDHFGNQIEPACYFGPFAVDPFYCGQGIGTKLIKHIEKLAIEANIFRFEIVIINWRSELLAMYTKMGFEVYGEAEYPHPEWLTRPSNFVLLRRDIK